MSRIWNWAREEFWQILPVWASFFVAFGLVALTRMSIFGECHIKPQERLSTLSARSSWPKWSCSSIPFLKSAEIPDVL
jgi:hypothetical protein